MTPLPSPFGKPGRIVSDGALVSLIPFGPFGSTSEIGKSTPAKLTFSGHFFEKARPNAGGEDETRTLATLDGDLLIDEELDPTITFTAKTGLVPDEEITDDDDDDDDDDDPSEVRVLRFNFDPDQFQAVGDESGATELLLRIDPARFHYCEVSALLEINDAEEAAADSNDVLDILITPRNPGRHLILSVRLTDDAGETLPNAAVTIVSGGKPADSAADPSALSADADGVIRIKNDPAAEFCELTWGPEGASDQQFSRQIFLDLSGDPEQADTRRLSNLGYSAETLEENVQSFQVDFARPITGRLGDISDDLRAFHDDGVEPAPGDEDEPSTDPIALGDGFEADSADDESDGTALA
ncbi:MAG TPA: hypothetical protein VGI10_14510 [Polyangiaceae bacterium]|jgi:hypothetical protein